MHKQICLIRHSLTAGNLRGNYTGCRTDEPLCAEGRDLLFKGIANGSYPDAGMLFLSPMKRCLETASILYPGLISREDAYDSSALSYELVEDFRECDFGVFEGLSFEDMKVDPLYLNWLDLGGMGKFPGGEDPKDFIKRCADAFSACLERIAGDEFPAVDRFSMVVHGGTIMSILSVYGPDKKEYYEWHIPCAGAFLIDLDTDSWKKGKKLDSVTRIV